MAGAELFTDSGDPLDMLVPLSEEELGVKFDELIEAAAAQPDDEVAVAGLRCLVTSAQENGQIAAAMQMAMTLGAMACMHPHLEEVAGDTDAQLASMLSSDSRSQSPDKETKPKDKKDEEAKKKKKKAMPSERRWWRRAGANRRPKSRQKK